MTRLWLAWAYKNDFHSDTAPDIHKWVKILRPLEIDPFSLSPSLRNMILSFSLKKAGYR